jgi:hypothetical protein
MPLYYETSANPVQIFADRIRLIRAAAEYEMDLETLVIVKTQSSCPPPE